MGFFDAEAREDRAAYTQMIREDGCDLVLSGGGTPLRGVMQEPRPAFRQEYAQEGIDPDEATRFVWFVPAAEFERPLDDEEFTVPAAGGQRYKIHKVIPETSGDIIVRVRLVCDTLDR